MSDVTKILNNINQIIFKEGVRNNFLADQK